MSPFVQWDQQISGDGIAASYLRWLPSNQHTGQVTNKGACSLASIDKILGIIQVSSLQCADLKVSSLTRCSAQPELDQVVCSFQLATFGVDSESASQTFNREATDGFEGESRVGGFELAGDAVFCDRLTV